MTLTLNDIDSGVSSEYSGPMQQSLKRSSALMRRAAFEQAPIGKVMQTSDGRLRAINRSLCLMLGYSEVELLTLTVPELRYPKTVAKEWKQYQALLDGQIESFTLAARTFWRGGRTLWGHLSITAIRDESKQVEWLLSQIHELTPGLELGPKVSYKQELLEEMAHVGSWDLVPESGECKWSHECFRIYGLDADSVTPSWELGLAMIHPEDRDALNETIRQVVETKQESQLHCRLQRPEGSLRHVLIQARVQSQPWQEHLILCGLILDVTEQWQKARLMEQANILLTEQNRQLDHMVRLATHNLRSPLANAISLTQMLEENCTEGERLEYQALLASSLGLALSNLEELVVQMYHQMPESIVRNQVTFQSALDQALIILSQEIRQSRALIETDFACESLEYASVYLNSIVYNLISNALKYRHLKHRLRITLRSWTEDGKVYLSVQDNGIGIDLSLNGPRMFKLHEALSQQHDAHGVGLYLTHSQIESLGGTISVSSQLGSGSTFLIRF